MAEIEKKYQLHSLPPPELLRRAVSIEQGYIVADDGELRIRKKGDAFYLTVKGAGGLEREEWEIEI
jgi:CYTH domain-containing protein